MRLPWAKPEDPYWDFFVQAPAADPRNQVNNAIRAAKPGVAFPIKAELHSPEITSAHVKELGRFFRADATGIVRLSNAHEDPFAIICVLRAAYDPRSALGHGGQSPVSQGLFVTFNIAAVIREWGYRATTTSDGDAPRLAAAAGLGSVGPDGRLVTHRFGAKTYVTDVIRTDLPLAPDGTTQL
ncbi:MAG TPA: hypothetical protein VFS62_13330 [Chloroflexota bacterium]|jgi:hypothetical protein|nr:hypothetical protein [Chloroflexota bacterium]